ncbi:AraC family transcriptional regulator [Paenibacillus sp. LHD-117]|uniref:AraC family transcriptional regulator n=1 Tax=Paenibacillus sp. LHD-117 TaxID=3071412 RepID=UPI0027E03A9D|nr:AraC family transcriptional regulator [Paenibacillus sp. LHD-117]MDQ6419125.1 AraC family transcriptional regulator [Paenibacillus sp. LHD-117]
MYQWDKSGERLNRFAGLLEGESVSFLIHYWGVEEDLPANPVHKHSFFELCYVNGGTGVYTEGETSHSLYPGVAFCSRPNVYHQIKDVTGLNLLFVAFEAIEDVHGDHQLESYNRSLLQSASWIDNVGESPTVQIWKSMLLRHPSASSLPVSLLPKLAYSLLRSAPYLLGAPNNADSTPVSASASQIVKRAKRYIRDNLDRPLSLSEVARYLNISERQLSRLIAGSIHESFTSIVHTERIRAAELLLTNTTEPIKAIAEQTGFSSVHYFTRLFSEAKGIPPGAFRAKLSASSDE